MKRFVQIQTVLLCLASMAATAVPDDLRGPMDLHHIVRLEGHGPRTVVLESGLGDTLDVWRDIQPRIADGCTLTVAYNRAGYAGSDPANGPRDSETIVAELRAELKRRNIKPPYVLVGHSLGGLYMQYFARNYPKEVVGLVLVDSTNWHEGMKKVGGAAANTPWGGGTAVRLYMPLIMRREINDSIAAGQQVHESPQARGFPTIVLSSTRAPNGETPATRALAADMQDEIAADFPEASHVRVADSGHYIQKDQPEVVIAAARRLAGCAVAPNTDTDPITQ
jgi:pimeloyl-ACP methyl ester carboxylesterase